MKKTERGRRKVKNKMEKQKEERGGRRMMMKNCSHHLLIST